MVLIKSATSVRSLFDEILPRDAEVRRDGTRSLREEGGRVRVFGPLVATPDTSVLRRFGWDRMRNLTAFDPSMDMRGDFKGIIIVSLSSLVPDFFTIVRLAEEVDFLKTRALRKSTWRIDGDRGRCWPWSSSLLCVVADAPWQKADAGRRYLLDRVVLVGRDNLVLGGREMTSFRALKSSMGVRVSAASCREELRRERVGEDTGTGEQDLRPERRFR